MYCYQTERSKIFTEDGQKMFLEIRDNCKKLLSQSEAVMMGRLMIGVGSSWVMMACVDRLVEIHELLEVPNPHSRAGQHRIFISSQLD